jgi:hypothetical protein
VRNVFKQVDTALALDNELVQHMQQQQQPAEPSVLDGATDSVSQAGNSRADAVGAASPPADANTAAPATLVDHAEDLQPLAEHLHQQVQFMHAQWRAALDARAVAVTENYRMGDELRDAREATHQAGQALAELQRDHGRVQGQLESSQVRALADRQQQQQQQRGASVVVLGTLRCMLYCYQSCAWRTYVFGTRNTVVSWAGRCVLHLLSCSCQCVQANAADLERRLLAAHDAVAKHLLELGDAEGQLANTRTKAESLEQR